MCTTEKFRFHQQNTIKYSPCQGTTHTQKQLNLHHSFNGILKCRINCLCWRNKSMAFRMLWRKAQICDLCEIQLWWNRHTKRQKGTEEKEKEKERVVEKFNGNVSAFSNQFKSFQQIFEFVTQYLSLFIRKNLCSAIENALPCTSTYVYSYLQLHINTTSSDTHNTIIWSFSCIYREMVWNVERKRLTCNTSTNYYKWE